MRSAPRWELVGLVVVLVVLYFVLRVGLGLGRLVPDLLVVALLIAAREMRAGRAAGLGLLLGVLDGAIVPPTLGASAFALTLLGFLGARSREVFGGESAIFMLLYLFLGKWLYDLLFSVVAGSVTRPGAASSLLLISPLTALYAAVAGLVAASLYRAIA